MEEKISQFTRWGIITLSVVITIIAVYILFSFSDPAPSNKPSNFQNEEVQIGGDFELRDQDDNIFNSDKLKGKLALVYFGFTYCPDICPESLQKLSKVLDILDKYNMDVNAVFITIDPMRDTQSLLKEYLSHFHNKIIGLTGTEEQIKNVADKFKVYYNRAQNSAVGNNYMMDHTTFIYLIDKNGKYLKHFYMDSTPEEIVECIRIHNNK